MRHTLYYVLSAHHFWYNALQDTGINPFCRGRQTMYSYILSSLVDVVGWSIASLKDEFALWEHAGTFHCKAVTELLFGCLQDARIEGSNWQSITLRDFFWFSMYECFTCMYVCVPRAFLVPMEARIGYTVFPGTGIMDGCEPPYVWQSNQSF